MKEKISIGVFEYLINLLTGLDPITQILLVIFIAPLLFIIVRLVKDKEFRYDFFKLIKSFKRRDTLYNIKNHEIFLSRSIYAQYIGNIAFNNKLKNKIFGIILETKIDTVLANLKKFNTNDFKDEGNIDLRMLTLVDDIVHQYEEKIKCNLLKIYKEDADFLYEKIYQDNFKPYHSSNISYILKAVKLFAKSRLSNNQKLYIFYNLSYIALDQSILDCEKLFDELNGDLDDYNEKWHS